MWVALEKLNILYRAAESAAQKKRLLTSHKDGKKPLKQKVGNEPNEKIKFDIDFASNFKVALGRGAYGIVYGSNIPEFKYMVVKEINVDPRYIKKQKRKVENEIRILGIVSKDSNHNMPKFYGFAENENQDFKIFHIYTERYNFELFDYTIEPTKYPLIDIIHDNIVGQLIEGLLYLHRIGVHHRDVKLENIMVHNSKGSYVLKYVDFGLAVTKDQEIRTFEVGTPSYIGPETLDSSPKDIVLSMYDTWALLVVLFTLLHGFFPFECANRRVGVCLLFEYFVLHETCKPIFKNKQPLIPLLSPENFHKLFLEMVTTLNPDDGGDRGGELNIKPDFSSEKFLRKENFTINIQTPITSTDP